MKKTGFTLIELIITLAVLSLLLALGIPQFSNSTANSRLTAGINTLSGDFAFARTEAVKRGVPITITATNVSDWAGGWSVAINASSPLRISPAINGDATITAGAASIQFNADGRTTAGAAVTFKLCDNRTGNVGKRLTLNPTGQAYLEIKQSCP